MTVGPWTIATFYKGDKFDNCSMSRSTAELDITLVRAPDGLLLLLDSQKWKLERGKAYNVRLVAGSRTVEAKALAEFKGVTIALEDRALRERLRTADALEVRGEGATLRVPLDGSAAALGRLKTAAQGSRVTRSLHLVVSHSCQLRCAANGRTMLQSSGNGRRVNGSRQKLSSPSYSASVSLTHDEQVSHTKIPIVPRFAGIEAERVSPRGMDTVNGLRFSSPPVHAFVASRLFLRHDFL